MIFTWFYNNVVLRIDCDLDRRFIIIIIMAGKAVVIKSDWLPDRGEAQMAYNYRFPTRTMF